MLDFQRDETDGIVLLTLNGNLDALTASELRPMIDELVEAAAVNNRLTLRLIESWFRGVGAGMQGFRTLKGGLPRTLAYLVAHESHHRGSILLTLKQCGHAVNRELRDGIWDWGRM